MKVKLLLALVPFVALLSTRAATPNPTLLAKAEAGNAAAEDGLGDFYFDEHTAKGFTDAATWYRKAADQGDPKAAYSLGISYCWHEGVPQDYAQAYYWLDLAVADKVNDENHWRNFAASHLTAEQLTQEQERVKKWQETHRARASSH